MYHDNTTVIAHVKHQSATRSSLHNPSPSSRVINYHLLIWLLTFSLLDWRHLQIWRTFYTLMKHNNKLKIENGIETIRLPTERHLQLPTITRETCETVILMLITRNFSLLPWASTALCSEFQWNTFKTSRRKQPVLKITFIFMCLSNDS